MWLGAACADAAVVYVVQLLLPLFRQKLLQTVNAHGIYIYILYIHMVQTFEYVSMAERDAARAICMMQSTEYVYL